MKDNRLESFKTKQQKSHPELCGLGGVQLQRLTPKTAASVYTLKMIMS